MTHTPRPSDTVTVRHALSLIPHLCAEALAQPMRRERVEALCEQMKPLCDPETVRRISAGLDNVNGLVLGKEPC